MRQDLQKKRKQWGGGGDVQVEIVGAKEFDEAMAQSIKEQPNQKYGEDQPIKVNAQSDMYQFADQPGLNKAYSEP